MADEKQEIVIGVRAEGVKQTTEDLNEVNDGLSKVGKSASEASKVFEESGAKTQKGSKGFKKIADSVKDINSKLPSANKSVSSFGNSFSKLFKSIGRIAFYRMLRTIIKDISQALKEGVQNLYQYSKLTNGDFYQSMDKIASAGQNIKNSLGVAIAPLLEALAPVIERIADLFIVAGNAVSKFFAALNGKSSYTAVRKSFKSYADSLSSASKSAKELKNTLLSFDELNVLNDNNDNGSSGISDMFTTVDFKTGDIDKNFQPIIDAINRIKSAWESIKDNPVTQKIIDWIGSLAYYVALGILDVFSSALEAVAFSLEAIALAFQGDWSGAITKWIEGLQKIAETLEAPFKRVYEWFTKVVDEVASWQLPSWLRTLLGLQTISVANNSAIKVLERYKSLLQEIKNLVSGNGNVGKLLRNAGGLLGSFSTFAGGGVVDNGQMFVARENGAELVGQIGNTTAVMNNDQIVSAVSSGVANAVASVMGSKNSGTQTIKVYLDSREIKAGQTRLARANG